MSKSCITDLQIYYCPSKQNPLCTKPTSNSNPQQPLLQRIRIQSSAAPLKGGRVLQFGDQFDLSADIPTGAWSFPLSHLDTPDGVGNLSKIKFAHTIQRSVWLMLFCFLQWPIKVKSKNTLPNPRNRNPFCLRSVLQSCLLPSTVY